MQIRSARSFAKLRRTYRPRSARTSKEEDREKEEGQHCDLGSV